MSCCDNCPDDCNCNDDPCFEDDATTCSHDPVLKTGADGKQIIVTCSDYTVAQGIDQVDVTKSGITITLPTNPEPGESVIVTTNSGTTTVSNGEDGDDEVTWTVPTSPRFAEFIYTSACQWVSTLAPNE